MIRLEPITKHNWRAALELGVLPGQERFVAARTPLAAVGLAKAFVQPGGWLIQPLGIYADDELVGFVCVCAHAALATECRIMHFFIDRRFQGRGCGRAALAAAIALIGEQYPDCRFIHLNAHEENAAARNLYERAGFVAGGPAIDGELPYQLRLK